MIKYNIEAPNISVKDIEVLGLGKPNIVKVIGEFSEGSAAKFYEDCERAVGLQQKVLPIMIDSFGGNVHSLLGMMDFMQSIRDTGVEVVTIACGKAMSCGAMLFCMGDKRYVGNRSKVLFHRFYGGAAGNPDDIKAKADEDVLLERSVFEECSKHIGKPKTWLMNQLKSKNYTDWYVSPDECLEKNIATNIGIPQFTYTIKTELTYE